MKNKFQQMQEDFKKYNGVKIEESSDIPDKYALKTASHRSQKIKETNEDLEAKYHDIKVFNKDKTSVLTFKYEDRKAGVNKQSRSAFKTYYKTEVEDIMTSEKSVREKSVAQTTIDKNLKEGKLSIYSFEEFVKIRDELRINNKEEIQSEEDFLNAPTLEGSEEEKYLLIEKELFKNYKARQKLNKIIGMFDLESPTLEKKLKEIEAEKRLLSMTNQEAFTEKFIEYKELKKEYDDRVEKVSQAEKDTVQYDKEIEELTTHLNISSEKLKEQGLLTSLVGKKKNNVKNKNLDLTKL